MSLLAPVPGQQQQQQQQQQQPGSPSGGRVSPTVSRVSVGSPNGGGESGGIAMDDGAPEALRLLGLMTDFASPLKRLLPVVLVLVEDPREPGLHAGEVANPGLVEQLARSLSFTAPDGGDVGASGWVVLPLSPSHLAPAGRIGQIIQRGQLAKDVYEEAATWDHRFSRKYIKKEEEAKKRAQRGKTQKMEEMEARDAAWRVRVVMPGRKAPPHERASVGPSTPWEKAKADRRRRARARKRKARERALLHNEHDKAKALYKQAKRCSLSAKEQRRPRGSSSDDSGSGSGSGSSEYDSGSGSEDGDGDGDGKRKDGQRRHTHHHVEREGKAMIEFMPGLKQRRHSSIVNFGSLLAGGADASNSDEDRAKRERRERRRRQSLKKRRKSIDEDYNEPVVNFEVFERMRQRLKDKMQRAVVIFRDMDASGDGKIDRKELKAGFVELGFRPTDEELRGLYDYLDKDGDGTVDYKELIKALKDTDVDLQKQKAETRAEMKKTAAAARAKAAQADARRRGDTNAENAALLKARIYCLRRRPKYGRAQVWTVVEVR